MTPHILLADDDDLALRITTLVFSKAGFRVTACASGDDAAALIRGPAEFDALVTDHFMPGLSGIDLIRLARHFRPRLPALIVTGYAELGDWSRLPPATQFLAKPFTAPTVIGIVRAMLAASPSPSPAGALAHA